MFGSLKQKLSNALQEGIVISESLHQQYRRVSSKKNVQTAQVNTSTIEVLSKSISFSQSSSNFLGYQFHDGVPTHLSLSSGSNILSNYEDDWQQIHDANEENVGHALVVADKINTILQRAIEHRKIINALNCCLAGVPALVIRLNQTLKTLQSLEQISAKLEIDFEQVENFCEELELQEFVFVHQFQLSKYKQAKLNNLEDFRKQIAEKHQEQILTYDHHLQQLQKERQAVFEDAFRGDLKEYIQNGQLTRIVPKTNQLSLEEVILEQNNLETNDALEQFLNG